MRIAIDQEACVGHGQCNATAPGVYNLDDAGFVVAVETVAVGAEDDATAGAAACPEQAITLIS